TISSRALLNLHLFLHRAWTMSPENLSTYGARRFHISRSEWDRYPVCLDFRLMNKKEKRTIGFFDSPPATCPLDPSPATSGSKLAPYVGCPFPL
ncbi:unnamed protein product, partial [Citrullus colocynthis]